MLPDYLPVREHLSPPVSNPEAKMESERATEDECLSVGVDAVPRHRYEDVTTYEGDLLVYDVESEDAWIQADCYYSLESCI